MRCSRAENLLSAFLDGELSDLRRERVDAHLGGCEGCRAQLAALRELSAEVRELESGDEQLSTTWETTLAARLAMVDADIEAEAEAAADRGAPVLPQVITMAAMLLMGLTLGLVGSRLAPSVMGSTDDPLAVATVDPVGSAARPPAAARGARAAEPNAEPNAEPDAESASASEIEQFLADVHEQRNELSRLAEDIYIVLTDAKVPEYLPGKSEEEKLHFFASELGVVKLRERCAETLVSLQNQPAEFLDASVRLEFAELADGVQDLCDSLRDGTLDARTRLMTARENCQNLLTRSAQAASRLQPPRGSSMTGQGTYQGGLPALATQVRYDALRRNGSMFNSRLNTLAQQLGEDHPYVHHHRSFWGPIAELRPDSSSVPLKSWLECNPEIEQSEIVFIIQAGGESWTTTRTVNFRFRAEFDPALRDLIIRQIREFRSFLEPAKFEPRATEVPEPQPPETGGEDRDR